MTDLGFSLSDPKIRKLWFKSGTLFDISKAAELLHWDQETYMPPKGILHRGRQLATLSEVYHEKLVDPHLGKLIDDLSENIQSRRQKYSDSDRALVREMKRSRDKALKIPPRLVRELAQASSEGLESWKTARRRKDFSVFQDSLQTIVRLKKEEAELIGYQKSPYDALLDDYEPDLTSHEVTKLFIPLKSEIMYLLKKIQKKNFKIEPFLKNKHFSRNKMIRITEKILRKIGYDFEAGRQDLSAHPFTINFGHRDVRLTNRYLPENLASSIFSSVHEGGHALYELGISESLANTLLAGGASLGLHESQSRFWENFVGRSAQFWQYWHPYLAEFLPNELKGSTPESIFREVNQVQPGLIRVEADEVTYNLHIILRFEIEKELIENRIRVKDLPEIWNHKMSAGLGMIPSDDSLGVLQDIHWSQGSIGYFPTYTLGNLYAAQFWAIIQKELPEINKHIESGNFEPILHWLKDNIYQFGAVYRAKDLIKKVTGESLNPRYFVDYLNQKYHNLYHL